ncbi:MAG: hypothetical protein KF708_16175 [Pirellulales bacterium]|nr:hypothetical protein [Pirellulales bacterium]
MVTQSSAVSADVSTCLAGMSFPGGFPRHFRVQRFDVAAGGWQLAATCTSRDEAQACYQCLLRGGTAARLIDYTRCVTGI